MARASIRLKELFLLLIIGQVFGDEDSQLRHKKYIRVASTPNAPYLMIKPDAATREGNDKYEGYIIDLLAEMAAKLDCQFSVYLVSDGSYGSFRNDTWTGLIGDILDGKADMAAIDMSVTAIRESVVDFTVPFMHVGISILYKRPSWPFGLPFNSLEELTSQSKIKFGVYCCGSSQAFFKNSKDPAKNRVVEMIDSFGEDGYTRSNLEGVQKVLDGNGEYAFLMESAAVEYVVGGNIHNAYIMESIGDEDVAADMCQLTQVGALIDSKMYSIALPQGSPDREVMNQVLLQLNEEGVLAAIKKKWWKTGKCKNNMGMVETLWSWLPSL